MAVTPAAASAAYTLRTDLGTARAVATLRAAGIDSVLIKGPITARWLYDDGALRSYGDLDLVVDPRRENHALEALGSLGYRDLLESPTERAAAPHARTLSAPVALATGQKTARSGAAEESITIDLHRSFHGVGVTDLEFWETISSDGGELTLFGVSVDVPTPPVSAMLVALHATAHATDGSQPLADLERALMRASDDIWVAAFELAQRLEASAPFVAALALSPRGRELTTRLGFSAGIDSATRLRAGAPPPVAKGLERLVETQGPLAKLRLLARELFPTAAYMRLWSPLARRGVPGLLLAYMGRPPWLIAKLPAAILALRRARRETGTSGGPT